jgi:hypothetical protein
VRYFFVPENILRVTLEIRAEISCRSSCKVSVTVVHFKGHAYSPHHYSAYTIRPTISLMCKCFMKFQHDFRNFFVRFILILSPVSISYLQVVSFGHASIVCSLHPPYQHIQPIADITTPFSVRKRCPLHKKLELSCPLEEKLASTVGYRPYFILGRFRLQISARSPAILKVSSIRPGRSLESTSN